MTVGQLIAALEAEGIGIELKPDGQGVKLLGSKQPPQHLIQAAKEKKAELIDWLSPPPEQDPLPEGWAIVGGTWVFMGADMPLTEQGTCGTCKRFKPLPEWGADMGECLCPSKAFVSGQKPLAIHSGCKCDAYGGKGWQASTAHLAPLPKLEDSA